jgi:tripeptidyl-peptidase I
MPHKSSRDAPANHDRDIPNGTHPELRSINGGLGPTNDIREAGSESNLDFQMAYGLIWPQNTVLYQVDDEDYQYNQTTNNTPYKGFFNSLSPLAQAKH